MSLVIDIVLNVENLLSNKTGYKTPLWLIIPTSMFAGFLIAIGLMISGGLTYTP